MLKVVTSITRKESLCMLPFDSASNMFIETIVFNLVTVLTARPLELSRTENGTWFRSSV